ncbi:MAG: hypothetical protein KZQ95_21950 [Candidatus Thiodiazotropha sp. (ex Epidulcina cf. delphinae)]|nr:hypothetical protein [Candidatus Thiodiazotropha sp. (ex Epidulcina cf. delphinae)]
MIRISCVKQKGQALPLGLALLMASILLGIVLFNTGQTASEKSRLANTADAAVYSGLIWQARALNFQAYTNRAMVANQVSIGQMVSLASWTKYAYILARNIDYIGTWFPIIKPYTQAAKSITEKVDDVVVNIAETFIPIVDSVNGVLSRAQQAVYLASFAATPAIVREVVEKNDDRYSATSAYAVIGLGENAMGWSDFAKQYDDQTGLQRKADVVNRSKDEFTNARNLGTSQLLPGVPNVLNLGLVRLWVRKEGRTNLITEDTSSSDDGETSASNTGNDTEWEWKGKDTLSLHEETWKCGRRGCGWRHKEIPLGWGSRYVNGDFECEENEDGREICPRYMSQNRRAERLADRESEELDADYNGLRAYYDLTDLSRENKDPRLALRTEVELPQSEVRTASKIDGLGSDSVPSEALRSGIGEGMFGTEDQMAGDGMTSIASGELFFHPPDDYSPARRRGRYEIASLFSPYWEVKLTKTPIERRFMAWALRDETLFTEGASGVAGGADHFLGEQTEELERLRRQQQALQSRLDGALDEATRVQIETRLNTVTARISALESIDYGTDSMTAGLRQEMAQGLGSAANAQVADYEQMLEASAAQQGEELVNQFEDEVVGQVTDQLQQALEQAVEDAVDNAMSSLL